MNILRDLEFIRDVYLIRRHCILNVLSNVRSDFHAFQFPIDTDWKQLSLMSYKHEHLHCIVHAHSYSCIRNLSCNCPTSIYLIGLNDLVEDINSIEYHSFHLNIVLYRGFCHFRIEFVLISAVSQWERKGKKKYEK